MCLFFVVFFLELILGFFFWQGWIFIAVHGLSLVVASGSYSLVLVHELLIVAASLVAKHGL